MKKLDEYLNEGKNDYMARIHGVNVTFKNGYKQHTEDELEKEYEKMGKFINGSKLTMKTIVIS